MNYTQKIVADTAGMSRANECDYFKGYMRGLDYAMNAIIDTSRNMDGEQRKVLFGVLDDLIGEDRCNDDRWSRADYLRKEENSKLSVEVRFTDAELVKLSLEAASLGKSLPQLIGDYTRDYLRCTGVKK